MCTACVHGVVSRVTPGATKDHVKRMELAGHRRHWSRASHTATRCTTLCKRGLKGGGVACYRGSELVKGEDILGREPVVTKRVLCVRTGMSMRAVVVHIHGTNAEGSARKIRPGTCRNGVRQLETDARVCDAADGGWMACGVCVWMCSALTRC